MKRLAIFGLALAVSAFPVWAQHGGAHGGGFGGGHAGGFGGHAAPSFHGGFSGGANRSFSGPAFRGGVRPSGSFAAPGSRAIARPIYGAPRYGMRTPYGSGIRYGARPPFAGSNYRGVGRGANSAWRGGFDRRRDGFDHRGRRGPYISPYWPTYSYYAYPWIWPSYPTILDCDNPGDNLDCGYGYGGYADNGYGNYGYENGPDNGGYDNGNYGMLGNDPGYDEPNLGAWPATPPQYQQTQPSEGQPMAAPSSEDAVTLIFKDGRPSEQIRNYVLTPTTLYAGDIAHRKVIPLDELDIPATEKVNNDAGVDFHVPQLQVQAVPNPGLPDTHVTNPQ